MKPTTLVLLAATTVGASDQRRRAGLLALAQAERDFARMSVDVAVPLAPDARR